MASARLKRLPGPAEATRAPLIAPSAGRAGEPNDLAVPKPDDRCYVCDRPRAEVEKRTELVRLFRRWQCRDRVDCYSAWRLT